MQDSSDNVKACVAGFCDNKCTPNFRGCKKLCTSSSLPVLARLKDQSPGAKFVTITSFTSAERHDQEEPSQLKIKRAAGTESQKTYSFLTVDPRTFTGTLDAAGDSSCSSGLLSLSTASDPWQVCCPAYCGDCTDYESCKNVNGMDSTDSCCRSRVYELRCGAGASASDCLHPCSKHGPPCIMDATVSIPEVSYSAADDCNEAVANWRRMANNAMEAAKDQVAGNSANEDKMNQFAETDSNYTALKEKEQELLSCQKDKVTYYDVRLDVIARDTSIDGHVKEKQKQYVNSLTELIANVEEAGGACDEKYKVFHTATTLNMKILTSRMTADSAQNKLRAAMTLVRKAIAKMDKYVADHPEFPSPPMYLRQ